MSCKIIIESINLSFCKLKTLIKHQIVKCFSLLFCSFAVLSSIQSAFSQDRIWKNRDGKTITARPIAKTETSVNLRMSDGKRVQVDIENLSTEDKEFLIKWNQPTVKVLASMQGAGWNGSKRIEKRRFEFNASNGANLVVFEDELENILPALKTIFELAAKPMEDVETYSKVVLKGKAIGVPGESELLIFKIKKGKPYCGGWGTNEYNGLMPVDKLYLLHDFLENFSVAAWDRQKDSIKRRFE